MLKLDNVTSFYGKTPILKNVNLGIDQGQCLCVLGRNGVGKTTLLQTIMGLTTRMTGELTVDGRDVSGYSTYRRAKAGLGYIPQGRRILGRFSVAENIRLGTFARKDDSRKLPDICLKMFPYLAENLNRRAGLLSGGQQQQLAIARALATDPSILLLDEPTEGIQPNIVAEIKAALVKLNRDMGITLVLTEQHIDIAKSIGHKFVVLDVGRVVHEGRIDELTQDVVEQHLTI